jgi:2-polyprenyl-3-methyl-5-hydroxy-6-metoxy-1,4-benzoquinol methylase
MPIAQRDPPPWQSLFLRPLIDLGAVGGDSLRGIFSPTYDEASVRRYVHEQFREHARTYATNYTDSPYFTWLLDIALKKIRWYESRAEHRLILDIGSGAGNSVVPLLKLCPDAQVVASDLSVELLVLLKQIVDRQGFGHRCGLLQLNAEELNFQPESFDLVVGAAILHHLIAPDSTVRGCATILRPGGHAMFFEPFENGNAILNLIYRDILQESEQRELAPEVSSFLRLLANDNAIRRGRDKSAPIFSQIDDKWLFTRSYFEELAEKASFSDCDIYTLNPPEQQFERQIAVNLRLGLGKDRSVLPQWAWDIVQEYEDGLSIDLKRDLLIEAGVILTR